MYKNSLNQIRNKNHEGIKFDAIFNKLKHFHVCSPGLPPCAGHDLFEGAVAYDLKFFIDYLIRNEWFTLSELNKRIDSFSYCTEYMRDKPCTISDTSDRISGGACQIWNFLRILPLLVADQIKDVHDTVWYTLLLLNELFEIVSSPTIHKSILPYLQSVICEYMYLRNTLFLAYCLRPKHHYILHYPTLIYQFGLLIKVWTLRFESKHRFFKRVMRYNLNFINVTKSLSEKHELLQSLVRLGSEIRLEVKVQEITDFRSTTYNCFIQSAIKRASLPDNIQQCNKVIYRGIEYKKGYVLAISQQSYQYNVVFGKVGLFLCNDTDIYILFEILNTSIEPHLSAYEVGELISYECRRLDEDFDFKPLPIYRIGNKKYIKLSHGYVSQEL